MQIFTNIQTALTAISLTIFTVCLIAAGIMIAVRMTGKRQEGFREALSSVSGILLGIVIAGGAAGIVALGTWAAGQISA